MKTFILCYIALFLLCCGVLSEEAPEQSQSTPSCIPACAEHNVTLMNHDELERARAESKQQQHTALRDRLVAHCAAREAKTCQMVAALQKRMVAETEASTWVMDNVDVNIAFCVLTTMHDLSIHSIYRACKNTLEVSMPSKGYAVYARFEENDRVYRTAIYDGNDLDLRRIRDYFAYLDAPPSKWSWNALWYGLCGPPR